MTTCQQTISVCMVGGDHQPQRANWCLSSSLGRVDVAVAVQPLPYFGMGQHTARSSHCSRFHCGGQQQQGQGKWTSTRVCCSTPGSQLPPFLLLNSPSLRMWPHCVLTKCSGSRRRWVHSALWQCYYQPSKTILITFLLILTKLPAATKQGFSQEHSYL